MSGKHMKSDNIENNTTKATTKKYQNNNENNKNKKKKHKLLKKFILFVIFIFIILAGIFAWKVYDNGGGLKGVLTTVVGSNSKKPLNEIQFLLMGESLNLTDTIIICSYNPNTQQATMISVQRDTYIGNSPNNPSAVDKINAQYAGKYPEKTLEAVNKITGLDLKYYVLIDTKALTELVDAIGGVDFEVPIDMNYHDTSKENFLTIELCKGMQKIDGKKAEQLLRFRHNDDGSTYPSDYGEEDLGRMRTQRAFITETLKQTLKPSNILKLGNIIDIATNNIKTNISFSLIKDYIPYAVEFDTENLLAEVLPGISKRPNSSGPYIYMLSEDEVQTLIARIFFGGVTEENINTEMPNIQILNASGNSQNLKNVAKQFKEKGYNILMVGNASKVSDKSSIINRTKKTTDECNAIVNTLGRGTVTDGKKFTNIDFTVTIGKDYNK